MKRAIYLAVVFMCCGVGFAHAAMNELRGTVAKPVAQYGEWKIWIDSPTQGILFCTRHRPFQDEQQQFSVHEQHDRWKYGIVLYCDQISNGIDKLVEERYGLRSIKKLFDTGAYVSQEKAINALRAIYPTVFDNVMITSEIEIINALKLKNHFFSNLIDKLVNQTIIALGKINGNTLDTLMSSMYDLPKVLNAYVLSQSLSLFCVTLCDKRTISDEQLSNLNKYYLSIVCEQAINASGCSSKQLKKIYNSELIQTLLPDDKLLLIEELEGQIDRLEEHILEFQ